MAVLGKNYCCCTRCSRGIFGNSIYTSEHPYFRKINSAKQVLMKGCRDEQMLTFLKESHERGLFNLLRATGRNAGLWEGGWEQRPTSASERDLVLWLRSCPYFHMACDTNSRTWIWPVMEVIGPQQG